MSGSSVKLHNCMNYTKYINTKNHATVISWRTNQATIEIAFGTRDTGPYMHCSGKGQTTCIVNQNFAHASLSYHSFLFVTVIQGKDFPSMKNLSLK